ncbi:MAG: helix-turn-helix transcriptional regulator, partial [Clostridia bacterium]|nr:helix-turn-helix transcriptional regulator [Clostridia bacterium]
MEKTLIEKAIKFIQNGSKENLSLQEIADKAGFSLTYFDALFKRHTGGYSPVEYSRVYKLTRSALELRRTDKKIIDIALDFGYESPEAYARAFKKFYSLSPSEYREKYS